MRKYLFVFLALCLVLSFSACDALNTTSETEDSSPRTSFYSISTNEDLTYSYQIVDKNGNVLFSDNHSQREPHIEQISDDVYSVTIQAGTGLSTNWAVYCDVKNSRVSETFQYVLGAQGDCVIWANYKDDKHFVTVQNIFDKSVYYKTYELENVSPVAADFAIGCKFDSDNDATITYLTGEDYTKTKMTVDFGDKSDNHSSVERTFFNHTTAAKDSATRLPSEYDVIIKNIINAFPWNKDEIHVVPENPELSYMYRRNAKLSEIGFALIDLDNNGQKELIISDATRPFIYDVYTMVNGEVTHLFDSGDRYYYVLYEGGYIESGWSGSAVTTGHDFYELRNGKLSFVERITMDAYHALDTGLINDLSNANKDNIYFRAKSDKFEDYQSISSEEASNAIKSHQNKSKPINITYTLLSEYK